MIVLPDVNVLVYAFRRESPSHDHYARWLSGVVSGAAELALTDATVTGFLRIVTNRRIYGRPAPLSTACSFVEVLVRASPTTWISANDAVWQTFSEMVRDDPQVRGNLVPDAWLAAMARGHGCRLATADRGFARFAGLDWFEPVRAGGTGGAAPT